MHSVFESLTQDKRQGGHICFDKFMMWFLGWQERRHGGKGMKQKHTCREINITKNSGGEKFKLEYQNLYQQWSDFFVTVHPDTPFLAQINCDNNRWVRGKEGRCTKKLEYRMLQIAEVLSWNITTCYFGIFQKVTCNRNGLVNEGLNPSMVVCQRIEPGDKYEKRN